MGRGEIGEGMKEKKMPRLAKPHVCSLAHPVRLYAAAGLACPFSREAALLPFAVRRAPNTTTLL